MPTPAAAVTVSPSGPVYGMASGTVLTAGPITVTCANSTLAATLSASGTGTVTGAHFTGCRSPTIGTVTVSPVLPWTLDVRAYPDGASVVVSGVAARLTSITNCWFSIGGAQQMHTLGAPPIPLPATATPAGASLRITASNPALCFGAALPGQAVTFSASYTLSQAVSVT